MAYVGYPVQPTVIRQSSSESALRSCDIIGPDYTGSLIMLASRDRSRMREGFLHMLARSIRQEEHPSGMEHVVLRFDAQSRQWQELAAFPREDERDGYAHMWKLQNGQAIDGPYRNAIVTADGQCAVIGEYLFKGESGRELHQWKIVDLSNGADYALGSPSMTMPVGAVVDGSGTEFYASHPNQGRVVTAVDGTLCKFYDLQTAVNYTFPVAATAKTREIGAQLVGACFSPDGMDLLLCTYDPRERLVRGYAYDLTATHKTVIGERHNTNAAGVFAFHGYGVALAPYADGWVMAVGDAVVVLDRNGGILEEVTLMPLSTGRAPIFVDVRVMNGTPVAVVIDRTLLCTVVDLVRRTSADQYLGYPTAADGNRATICKICMSGTGAQLYVQFVYGDSRWVNEYVIASLYAQMTAVRDANSGQSRNVLRRTESAAPKPEAPAASPRTGSRPRKAARKAPDSRKPAQRRTVEELQFGGWSSWGSDDSASTSASSDASTAQKPERKKRKEKIEPTFGGWQEWGDDSSAPAASVEEEQQHSSTQRNDDQSSFDGWSSW